MQIHSKSGNGNSPHILLVNPWIHDFAAYDFWAKPYGLLCLGALLRDHGLRVSYIDCLDRFHPLAPPTDPHARHGRGPYRKQSIPPPKSLLNIKRTYSRYGIDPAWFFKDLKALEPPDLILVSSMMTYWYPGVVETIGMIRKIYPQVPLVLGGIYARLCTEHARRFSGADEVVTDRGESLFNLVQRLTGYDAGAKINLADWNAWPYPALDLQHTINYAPLLTSRGCPFACGYCASDFLEPSMVRRSWQKVVSEIDHWHHRYGVTDFAFYDDALLVNAREHALPMLEEIVRRQLPIHLHTPNAIHIRAVTAESALLMKAAGFKTLRLGLETTAFEDRSSLDCKVTRAEFVQAIRFLKSAGFSPDQIGAYLLVGLPGQRVQGMVASIQLVKEAGITPVLAHYTPIPHTRLWPEAVRTSRYDLNADPVLTNNAIFPCRREDFSWPVLSRLKKVIAQPLE